MATSYHFPATLNYKFPIRNSQNKDIHNFSIRHIPCPDCITGTFLSKNVGKCTFFSYSAAFYNRQPISRQIESDASGMIAVDPIGNNIVYFGGSLFPLVCYYNKLGDILYSFNILSYNTFVGFGSNSLQFFNETNLFYISSSDQYVQHFKWQENYCANPSINAYLNM
jgi:hypothetical protein